MDHGIGKAEDRMPCWLFKAWDWRRDKNNGLDVVGSGVRSIALQLAVLLVREQATLGT